MSMSKKWKACAIGLCIGLQSCGELRQLEPSMKVNQANAKELKNGVSQTLDLLAPLAGKIIELELIERRRDIALGLNEMAGHIGVSESISVGDIEAALDDPESDFTKTLGRIQSALSANNGDSQKERDIRAKLKAEYPVYAALSVDPGLKEEIVESIRIVWVLEDENRSDGQTVVEQQALYHELSLPFSYYTDILELKGTVEASIADYRKTVVQQLHLLELHAELFVFAAEQQVDVNRVFTELLGDEGFESQVLALIGSESVQDDAKMVFDSIRELSGVLDTAIEKD